MTATLRRRTGIHALRAFKLLLNYRGQRRAIVRGYAFRAMGRLGASIIGFDGPGGTYLVRSDDVALGGSAFQGRGFEEDKLALVVEQIGARGILIDVGANVGVTTLPALSRFGFEKVIAIEPAPDNLRLLRAVLALNGIEDRVEIVAAGASARSGSMELELSPNNSGDHRIRMTNVDGGFGEAQRASVTIRVVRVDDLDVDPSRVGLLWIDVQGHEGHVLAGAQRLLSHRVPTVIEYWPYGLRRAGGLDLLHGLIRDHFETVLDLTTGETYPARAVDELAHIYTARAPSPATPGPEDRYTDCLLR